MLGSVKGEKNQRTIRKDQSGSYKHERKFSLSLSLSANRSPLQSPGKFTRCDSYSLNTAGRITEPKWPNGSELYAAAARSRV